MSDIGEKSDKKKTGGGEDKVRQEFSKRTPAQNEPTETQNTKVCPTEGPIAVEKISKIRERESEIGRIENERERNKNSTEEVTVKQGKYVFKFKRLKK